MRRLRRVAPAALVALALRPATAAAQRAVPTLDVGGASIRYADSVAASGASLSPALAVEWSRATLGASGTFSQFGPGWSTQGALDLSLFTPTLGPLVGEVEGSAGGSAHRDGSRTGEALAVARAYAIAARGGGWAGGGAGRTWDGLVWRGLRLAEVGGWAALGPANTTLVTVTPTVVDDTIRYTDAQLAVRWALPRLDLGVTAGGRSGQRLPTFGGTAKAWASGSATLWLASRLALVASAGTYPVDLTQGFPGGRFVSASIRLGARTTRAGSTRGADQGADRAASGATPASAATTIAAATRAAPAVELRVAPAASGRRALRVRAPGAGRVELMGDFTSWQPVRLAPAGDGWWVVALPVARGTHQVNVRLDGGAWRVPDGLTRVDDEFGGAVGVLVVE